MCVCVRKTLEAGSLVVLSTRQCRLLLNKYGLRVSLLGNSTLGLGTHTHTHRVIVYICFPTNSMTICRPASVLLLIYGLYVLISLQRTSSYTAPLPLPLEL